MKATTSTPRLLTEHDLYLFNEGTHYRLYEKLGAHPLRRQGGEGARAAAPRNADAALGGEQAAPENEETPREEACLGTHFAVWAPNAQSVSVIGDWNGWDKKADPLAPRGGSGLWEGFLAGAAPGARYKYHIVSRLHGYRVDKADPFAFHAETPPQRASVVWDMAYAWSDGEWMGERAARQSLGAPISAYEVHLGSWRRVPEEGSRFLTYREIAPLLAEHVRRLGFTHVELMPVMEHPFYGSWGYQGTGYFAATSRYGTPQDLMYLIDYLHGQGIGVFLDWVPSHFPTDEHGLAFFDGTHLYEHADPRRGVQPDWGSLIFNYGRREVRSFLISSAAFWLDRYHADGLRVDAVASMLYLDYSRHQGEWIPNRFGGRENLEAIEFLRELNSEVYGSFPAVHTIAEESTAWPMVSRPVYLGGLGFGMKWDMGWMHDTLSYLEKDPIHRRFHHNQLTFRSLYAWNENFVLPLSHDEVVHGKGSLLAKMAGDPWQKRANLRLLFAWMVAQPGKKLLFMGAELAPWQEWNHDGSLDWRLLDDPAHAGICRWLEDLNRLYRERPALHQLDCRPEGFSWIDGSDAENSVLAFARLAGASSATQPGSDAPPDADAGAEDSAPGSDASPEAPEPAAPPPPIVVVFNFTPIPRTNYRIGVPEGGFWQEILNSDGAHYGGSGQGNFGGVEASPLPLHGRTHSLTLTLPPLGALFLEPRRAGSAQRSKSAGKAESAERAGAAEQADGAERADNARQADGAKTR
ncbi:MAG TPA: 1,4-alpha-glucan branching protein GlgB [Thermoanaerobaculia bacterium]|nr:1,4-alpha-glucan branching protein GlgB [Thermoanaerobaculia bacterium]